MIRRTLLLIRPMISRISYRGIGKNTRDTNFADHMKHKFFDFLKEEAFGDVETATDQKFQNPDILLSNYENLIKTPSSTESLAQFYSEFSSSIGGLSKNDILRFLNLSTLDSMKRLYGTTNQPIDVQLLYDIRQNQIVQQNYTSGILPVKAFTNSYKNISKGIFESIFGSSTPDKADIKSLRSFVFQALEKPISLYISKGRTNFTVKELISILKAFTAAQEGTELFYESLGEGLLSKAKDFDLEDIDCFLNLFPHELWTTYNSEAQTFFTSGYYSQLAKVTEKINELDAKMFLSIFQGLLTIDPVICNLKEAMDMYFERFIQRLEKNELSNKQVAKFLEVLATHIETKGRDNFNIEVLVRYLYDLYISKTDLDKLSLPEITSILSSCSRMNALSAKYFSRLFESGVDKIKKLDYTSYKQNLDKLKESIKILIEVGDRLASPSVSVLNKIIKNIK